MQGAVIRVGKEIQTFEVWPTIWAPTSRDFYFHILFDTPTADQLHHFAAKRVKPQNMDYRGVTVQITLKQPPNTVLHGKVVDILAGQSITLQDGTNLRWLCIR